VNFEELQLNKKNEDHENTIQRLESEGKQAPRQQGICFRLQVGATKAKNNKMFEKLGKTNLPTYCAKESDGLYRYTVGSFKSFEEANKQKEKIDELGYNSFVVAYENGNRISINEALRKLQKSECK
jgi:cell division septation protein DedD